jgi:RNA polymerase sigma-70 factor (ECF subfamily)
MAAPRRPITEMAAPDDDLGLVRASQGGDTAAFGQLVQRHQDRLFATLLRLTGSYEDARDALQEAFFRAFRKLDRFHGDSAFYTWIYRIAVNLAISERRKRRPHCRAVPAHELDHVEPASGDDQDPGAPLERAELDAIVQHALNRLPDDQRVVVVLRDLDGLSYEQIAEVLAVPIGTVRSRLHRARGELRQRLEAVLEPVSASPAVVRPARGTEPSPCLESGPYP